MIVGFNVRADSQAKRIVTEKKNWFEIL
jgi:hypothetical protein